MLNVIEKFAARKFIYSSAAILLGIYIFAVGASAEVLFEENFDSLEDWTSTMHTTANLQAVDNGDILPGNWWGIYQGTQWSPETGYPDNHASLEILQKNADKARGGAGKSAVYWRESHSRGWNNWASDAQLVKVLENDHKELYFEFYIRFSGNWWQRADSNVGPWESKIFRVGHWSRKGSIWNHQGGEINPRMIWQYKKDSYGLRNVVLLRHGPPGQNEKIPQGGSMNYSSHTLGHEEEGGKLGLANALNPSQSLANFGSNVGHEEVFGKSENWTKVAFYLRINSAPGVSDGVLRQWLNDQRILNIEDIEWVKPGPGAEKIGWNYFAIGGNDYFQAFPNEQRFEDWFAIDDLVVATEPFNGVAANDKVAPNPPSNISVSD